jgi:predicted RND superfamily exporter protein
MNRFWSSLSHFILNHRVALLLTLAVVTVGMGFVASRVRLSYELVKILPASDPNFQVYEAFKKRYGEDGNVLVAGVSTPNMYRLDFFRDWCALSDRIKRMEGIKDVLSNADLYEVVRNDSLKRFDFKPLLTHPPTSQAGVDSVRRRIAALPFYKGFIFSDDGQAHLMAITFDQKTLNDKNRIAVVGRIKNEMLAFGARQGVRVHLSGMPYIRTEYTATVVREMGLFMVLAVVVTALVLAAFFRSFAAVGFALLVVLAGVVWALGLTVLFGYKIQILLGLVPPLIVIIGIPNTIFLLNKYHEEYARHGHQRRALEVAVEKIGQTTFLANLTTAIGFGVFAFTGSQMLVEFGQVASVSVLLTYAIALVVIPSLFSYLPPPAEKHVQRLEGRRLMAILGFIERLVRTRRVAIYGFIAVLVLVSAYGASRIRAVGFVVDDLPRDSPIYDDLKFFERHFHGVVPFEVSIDAQRPGRVLSVPVLTKIRRLEKEFATHPEFTEPLSIVRALKFLYQAYRGGDPKYYVLPGIAELSKMQQFQTSLGRGVSKRYAGFLDSTQRFTRVSFQMADLGTVRTTQLVNELQPKLDTIFNYDTETGRMLTGADRYEARITGNGVVFTKGNEYLQSNLVESTILAIVLISILMWALFLDPRMIAIATVPSLIPLLITAGIMGFGGIALKPSTILIFSIAFGISSDGSIYFLTRYKDELRNRGKTVAEAVSSTILNTGVSMFYTAIILFAGFFIFTASEFRGTKALGVLVSVTLLIAMISNLVLLPAFLIGLDRRRAKKQFQEPKNAR